MSLETMPGTLTKATTIMDKNKHCWFYDRYYGIEFDHGWSLLRIGCFWCARTSS